jgi:hypothetical protein
VCSEVVNVTSWHISWQTDCLVNEHVIVIVSCTTDLVLVGYVSFSFSYFLFSLCLFSLQVTSTKITW